MYFHRLFSVVVLSPFLTTFEAERKYFSTLVLPPLQWATDTKSNSTEAAKLAGVEDTILM